MKTYLPMLLCLASVLLSSFKSEVPCEKLAYYAGFVHEQIGIALDQAEFKQLKYHTYKAINLMEKAKQPLKECDCEHADYFSDALDDLIRASKSEYQTQALTYLTKASEELDLGLQQLNTKIVSKLDGRGPVFVTYDGANTLQLSDTLKDRIEKTLEKYSISIQTVMETVDCQQAHDFVEKIYEQCEMELENPKLTSGQKYYNLRVREITQEASKNLPLCQ